MNQDKLLGKYELCVKIITLANLKEAVTMKKLKVILLAALFVAVAASVAFAHPPKNVTCTWNAQTSVLTVTAVHEVNDPAKHFVLTLTVLENGKQIAFKQYSKQNSASQFSDSVALPGVKSGAKLRVILMCNIMGSAESDYIIP